MAQVVTLTNSDESVNTGNWTKLNLPPSAPGARDGHPQLLATSAYANGSSGSGTVDLAIYDPDLDKVIEHKTLTITATSVKVDPDGASGSDCVCTVASSDTQTPLIDLVKLTGNRELRVGHIAEFDTITSITLIFDWTSKV